MDTLLPFRTTDLEVQGACRLIFQQVRLLFDMGEELH